MCANPIKKHRALEYSPPRLFPYRINGLSPLLRV
jgi:hypothetical protein